MVVILRERAVDLATIVEGILCESIGEAELGGLIEIVFPSIANTINRFLFIVAGRIAFHVDHRRQLSLVGFIDALQNAKKIRPKSPTGRRSINDVRPFRHEVEINGNLIECKSSLTDYGADFFYLLEREQNPTTWSEKWSKIVGLD